MPFLNQLQIVVSDEFGQKHLDDLLKDLASVREIKKFRKCYHLESFLNFMEIQQIVEKILKVSPSVRVVSVVDLKGKLVFSERAKKVKILVSKKQSLASLKAASKDWRQRKKLVKTLGTCKYVVAEYDKIKRIIMPAGRNHILYITTTATLDHNKVVRKVRSFK